MTDTPFLHTPGNIGDLVLYKNNQLIAFNKPGGLPSQDDLTKEKSMLNLAEIYCKAPVYILNRIDRPTSGVILFAKTKQAQVNMNEQLRSGAIEKSYLAVVDKDILPLKQVLTHALFKDSKRKQAIVVSPDHPKSKVATLSYEVVETIDRYALLLITTSTGRFHQIRAQLAQIGFPIKGDVKYGSRRANKEKFIHLHAWKMSFVHPVSHESVMLQAPVPNDSVWQAFQYPQSH
jgi:23S rRNA pseudouridine1911/1915/1917 synthase